MTTYYRLQKLFDFEDQFKSPELSEFETIPQLSDGVIIRGWIRTLRLQKGGKLYFVTVYDGYHEDVQILVDDSVEGFQRMKDLSTDCACEFEGALVKSPAKGQTFELQCSRFKIYGTPHDPKDYPLGKTGKGKRGKQQRHTLEYMRKFFHLRTRKKTGAAVARVYALLKRACREFMFAQDIMEVEPPTITGSDCEGAGDTFRVTTMQLPSHSTPAKTLPKQTLEEDDFFKQPAYLTVSRQVDMEPCAIGLGRVYCFGQCFRAEHSGTSRHLCEFGMIEPEVCFISFKELVDLAEDHVKFCISFALEHCAQDIQLLSKVCKFDGAQKTQPRFYTDILTQLRDFVEKPFIRMTYTEAITLLEKAVADGLQFEEPIKWGIDLASEHEKWLTDICFERPVILTHYPQEIKSFYMKKCDDPTADQSQTVVECFDLLVPGVGELIGGSMRENDYDALVGRMTKLGLPLSDYQAYLDVRRFGSVPHGGYGMGFERLVKFVTGLLQIKDCTLFPRYYGGTL